MAVAECGIRENLAEYYDQKSAPVRLEGMGGEARQTPIFFTQTRNRGLNDSVSTIQPCEAGLDSQYYSGVDVMTRISHTKASRAAAEHEEYHRIDVLLDQALELTFPCSDPVAITIDGYDMFRRKSATPIPAQSVSPPPDPKDSEGKPDKANLFSSNPVMGNSVRPTTHRSGRPPSATNLKLFGRKKQVTDVRCWHKAEMPIPSAMSALEGKADMLPHGSTGENC